MVLILRLRVGGHLDRLVELGEGVVLALVRLAAPVVEHQAVPPGRVGEGHPLPGPHPPHAQLRSQLLVPLVCKVEYRLMSDV
jgi:hypothetical protein